MTIFCKIWLKFGTTPRKVAVAMIVKMIAVIVAVSFDARPSYLTVGSLQMKNPTNMVQTPATTANSDRANKLAQTRGESL